MTIKSLLFCLFLYVCLVWVGCCLLEHGLRQTSNITDCLWTGDWLDRGIGIRSSALACLAGGVCGGPRLQRGRRPQLSPYPPVHPDDEAMRALIAEANAALGQGAIACRQARGGVSLSAMPLYLLIGPEGSGKTSTFLNSGIEPQLLAGQGTAPVAPRRLCNLWLAEGCDLCRNRRSSCLPANLAGGVNYCQRCAHRPRFLSGGAFGANPKRGSRPPRSHCLL